MILFHDREFNYVDKIQFLYFSYCVVAVVVVIKGILVHVLSALFGAASARNLDVFEGELVIVSQLFADLDLS